MKILSDTGYVELENLFSTEKGTPVPILSVHSMSIIFPIQIKCVAHGPSLHHRLHLVPAVNSTHG